MELKDQVVNLEFARKLKALGVPQQSHCWHVIMNGTDLIACGERKWADCAAFTVAELGEMLPAGSSTMKVNGSWGCELVGRNLQACNTYQPDQKWSEADARARMLIYLIEKGIVRP